MQLAKPRAVDLLGGVRIGMAGLLTVFLAPTLLSAEVSAQEPTREEVYFPDEYPPPATNGATLLTGAVMTGAFYGASVAYYFLAPQYGASPDSPGPELTGRTDLLYPVVGPFMAMDTLGRCAHSEGEDCSAVYPTVRIALAALVGLGQIGGLGVMLEGLMVPSLAPGAQELPPRHQPPSATVVPLLDEETMGLSVTGFF